MSQLGDQAQFLDYCLGNAAPALKNSAIIKNRTIVFTIEI